MKTKTILYAVSSLMACVSFATSASDINRRDDDGKTAVMQQLEHWQHGQSLDEIGKLVGDKNFNPHVKDRNNLTALDYAKATKAKPIEYGIDLKLHAESYKKLQKEHYGTVFSDHSHWREELIRAVIKGQKPQIEEFLSKNSSLDLNYTLRNGISPLSATSLIKDVNLAGSIFLILVKHGARADLNYDSLGGDTLGHIFCKSDNYLMLLLAVSKGLNPNSTNQSNQTIYNYSIQNNSTFCAEHIQNILNITDE